jgi:hypothetical protein
VVEKRARAVWGTGQAAVGFFIDLEDHDYLRVIEKHNTEEPSSNFGAHGRHCGAFYLSGFEVRMRRLRLMTKRPA